ncbi:MAG: four helix bundle protein [Prevotellaceae bacterium]|jgi:four helix bundle protein|nr:four helix bundle protein [Prevotellaceae bacterium]
MNSYSYTDFRNLAAYQKAFEQANFIFQISLIFPKEERYSLTDQIRRSSRSVCANFAEAYRKREYEKHFLMKITDCLAENSETLVWLDFAINCKYLSEENYHIAIKLNEETGKLLTFMFNNPYKFGVKPITRLP